MEANLLIVLGFLSILIIGGAIAFGSGVRGTWEKVNGKGSSIFRALFLIVAGVIFGCAPIALGLNPAVPNWVLPGQLALWGLTFVLAALVGEQVIAWVRSRHSINFGLLIFGGVFMVVGVYAAYIALNDGEPVLSAILVVAVFGIIGAGIFLLGAINIFRGR